MFDRGVTVIPQRQVFGPKIRRTLEMGARHVSTGIHPSQASDFCPIYHTYMQEAIRWLNEPCSEVSDHAHRVLVNDLKTFAPGGTAYLRMGMGTAMHTMLQYYGGLAGLQVGQWRCPECGHLVGSDDELEYMPHSMRMGMAGMEVIPDGCPACGGKNLRHDWAWHYVEPRISIPDLGIYGKTDGFWVIEEAGQDLFGVIDYKSCNDNSWKTSLPIKKHMLQLQIYALAASKQYQIDFAALVYVNKDTSEIREYYYEPDADSISGFLTKAKVAKTAVVSGRVPSAKHRVCSSADTARARKCQFRRECFNLEE